MIGTENILLFDGDCNLCNGVVRFTIKRDHKRKIKFTSLQSVHGQELLRHYQLPTTDFDSFVYITPKRYYLRSSAALRLLKDFGGLWQLCYVFMIVPPFIRDFCYRIVARNRHRLMSGRACMLPTSDIKKRFL